MGFPSSLWVYTISAPVAQCSNCGGRIILWYEWSLLFLESSKSFTCLPNMRMRLKGTQGRVNKWDCCRVHRSNENTYTANWPPVHTVHSTGKPYNCLPSHDLMIKGPSFHGGGWLSIAEGSPLNCQVVMVSQENQYTSVSTPLKLSSMQELQNMDVLPFNDWLEVLSSNFIQRSRRNERGYEVSEATFSSGCCTREPDNKAGCSSVSVYDSNITKVFDQTPRLL